MTQIVTGDAVVLDLRPARVPTRLLGVLVDLGVCALATWGWWSVVDAVVGSVALVQAVQITGSILILFGYPIAVETITRGRTLGLWALGLRAVRDDGGTIRFRHSLMRWLTFWTVDFAIWTGLCAGLVCAVINPQGKRFGDLLAGTMVIRVRSPQPLPLPATPAPHLVEWARQVELSRVPDTLWSAARMFVARSAGMTAYPRRTTAQSLARQLSLRTAPPPPVGTEPEAFVATLVHERRRREQDKVLARQWVPDAAELPEGWR